MLRLLAERSDTKSNVKLDGFRSRLQASHVSSHTEEFWENETVCLWMAIYTYIYIEIHDIEFCAEIFEVNSCSLLFIKSMINIRPQTYRQVCGT